MNYRDIRGMLPHTEESFSGNDTSSSAAVTPDVTPDVTPKKFNTTKFALCLAGIAGTALCGAAAYIANNPEAMNVITNFLNR